MSETGKELGRRKANTSFTASEARDALVKKELAAERAAFEAKTAKLRALRLAKEAADAETALKLAANAPPGAKKPARKKAAKTASA
ncbi:MAG TPA: hypothetical protein VG387_02210 [Rhizomicrobium sp.]|jgi:hypothetical protein|nr:hypothetical protein [Rhizomicrobium sp.]